MITIKQKYRLVKNILFYVFLYIRLSEYSVKRYEIIDKLIVFYISMIIEFRLTFNF